MRQYMFDEDEDVTIILTPEDQKKILDDEDITENNSDFEIVD